MNHTATVTWREKRAALAGHLPEKGSFAWIMMMMGLATIPLILLPFTFWYLVWHGSAIPAEEVKSALAEPVKPGQAGAVLLRLGEKMSRGDESVVRWYPRIAELSRHESAQLRKNVAWTMGKDLRHAEFRSSLHAMLGDPEPRVRRAAAISLALAGDAAARPVLLEAIGLQVVLSPFAGSVNPRIQPADTATADTAVARVGEQFVEAGTAGTVKRVLVKDGELVSKGQALIEMTAPDDELIDGLRALAHVGTAADADAITACAKLASGENKAVVENQAQRTLRQIAARTR